METPIKIDDLGVPWFLETPTFSIRGKKLEFFYVRSLVVSLVGVYDFGGEDEIRKKLRTQMSNV